MRSLPSSRKGPAALPPSRIFNSQVGALVMSRYTASSSCAWAVSDCCTTAVKNVRAYSVQVRSVAPPSGMSERASCSTS